MADTDPELAAQLLAAFSVPAPIEEKHEPEPLVQEPQSQAPGPHVHTPETQAQQPQAQAQQPEFQEPPLIPPPPPSPEKRHRTPEHEGYIGQKRLKTDHDGYEHRAVDLSAANWDISAMIQNALGSFDEQLHHPDHMDHSEQLNHHGEPDHHASHEPISEPAPQSPPLVRRMEHKHMKFSSNPYYVMRTMSLASLGSLAIQILLALSQQSREETLALISDQESEYRTAYDTLKSALDAARRIFSDTNPLLSPDELDISDSEDRETLRVSNLAAISTNAIAGDDSLLVDAHDQFFSIFIPDDGEFSKDLSGLYTNLKTQAMLSSLKNATNPQERSDVLDRFFPPDFDEVLKQRYGDTPFQSGREELVAEIGRKRQELLESILDDEKRQRLSEEYPMNGFLDSLVAYLQNHLAVVIEYAEKYGINIPVSEESVVNEPLENRNVQDDHDELSALLQSATSKLLDELPLGDMGDSAGDSLSDSLGLGKLIQESLQNQIGPVKDEGAGSSTGDGSGLFESGGLASLIAAKLNNGFDSLANLSQNLANGQGQQQGLGQASSAPMQSPYLAQYNQLSQAPYYSYNNQPPPPPPPPPADGEPLPPNQTLPTSLLYERARQAAVAKSNSAARREGIHSTRRAWTPEEERALMTGLDMVKGPHWSQILSLFGANGTMSDILKDRTQVQLKDKARNLKLFFLKTNSEMPYYLQCVTGELKTRAPGQAARKEAEEKARQNSEEEQARIQGIMTLAGGLQHNHHPVSNQQVSQVNNHQANQVSNHQVNQYSQVNNHQVNNGLSNSHSNGQMPMPMQGSPAQARTTPLLPTTPTPSPSVGQNGGMATMTPNTNMGPGNPGTHNIGTTAPMTPSISSAAPLTPRIGGNNGMGLPTPSIAPASGAPTPTPMSPPVKTEPQDHLTPIQPKPEPHPLQSPQHTEQQGQMQQPQQRQQSQQPYVHITLPGTQPPTLAHAPEPAQPFTHSATDINNSPGVQPPGVSTQQNYHQDDPMDGLARLFDHQPQPLLPPHESHNGNNDDVELFGHHDPNDHHDATDIASLLQTLQAATASI